MASAIADIAELGQLKSLMYFDVSALALLTVDYFATLPSEIRLIWPTRTTMINVLYFFNRHVVFLSIVTTRLVPSLDCRTMNMISNCARVATVLISESLLFARVWALSGNGRTLGFILLAFWVAIAAAAFGLMIKYVLTALFEPSLYPSVIKCIPIHNDSMWSSLAVGIIIVEQIFIMVLCFYYGIRRRARSGSRLAKVVYTDGLIYFVALTLIAVINAIIQLTVKGNIRFALNPFQMAMHSILATRMVLNLRAEARGKMGFATLHESESHTMSSFVAPVPPGVSHSISLQPMRLNQNQQK
ncbi:hypothetical protein FA13DRAFT_1784153 [Coprinellus micaceus]|uniref:DUF6533 domain-containing protein n=1 Tax=Coprinellus micaceus TaxID=71717 RepID=A0A4Y7TZZ9_COPMI|nr:hypothetical protein FA13DRAFT_1784153 [Coprinellus micaceus]